MYDKLVTEVNIIDTSGFVLNTQYDTDKWGLEKKISNTIGLIKKQIIMLRQLRLKVKRLELQA